VVVVDIRRVMFVTPAQLLVDGRLVVTVFYKVRNRRVVPYTTTRLIMTVKSFGFS